MSSLIDPSQNPASGIVDQCLAGGGEMGALLRSIDWANTPWGPVATWPTSLRTIVAVMLGSPFPMCIWWGREFRHLYNDGYRPMLGKKHPASIAQLASEVWAEIWDVVGPMGVQILNGGPATYSADMLLEMNRYGFIEETYFTFAYSPIPGENGNVGGALVTAQETTGQILTERRLKTLRDLAARAAEAKAAEEACATAAEVLGANSADVPFALLYLIESEGNHARLISSVGIDRNHIAAPEIIVMDQGTRDDGPNNSWPLAAVEKMGRGLELTDLADRFGRLPGGRWPEPANSAILAPLRRSGQGRPYGFLIAGISLRLKLDHRYRGFVELAVDQIATAIANARAHEEERRRAQALAEIDRAKTTFFSNVSHEFRTPLTLMLGPLEDLVGGRTGLSAEHRQQLELLQRNGLRLLKLVNTLLDFTRIEAGRVQASYQETDIAALTTELASSFQSLAEKAGLSLDVHCERIDSKCFVDPEMWEKIVLNLISNAFKFTFQGTITVGLKPAGRNLELSVSDTGVGIPEHELTKIFERFHRVEGARARTYEGSGIGLALVSELVRMHGGKIAVASRPDSGSTFTVSIPTGSEHLPSDRICAPGRVASAAVGAAPFLEEAASWLDNESRSETMAPEIARVEQDRPEIMGDGNVQVLLVDDNADMRGYIKRLLAPYCTVHTVRNGLEALDAVRESLPDLVLTDVMMPKLDGYGLLRALRENPSTSSVPIILLSARAGEESQVEGLTYGADDYLVKPFSARELIARVRAHLQLHRFRQKLLHEREELIAREQEAKRQAEQANRAKDEFLAMLGHELRNPLSPILTSLNLMQMRDSDSFRRERDIIERQVRHLARLIDDLLDVSRITRGKIQLKPEPLELITVVVKAIEMASPIIEQQMHHLIATVPNSGLKLEADPTRLSQVISNLLTNAAKYTDRGGKIWIRASREDRHIVLRVRDDGIGMSPEMLPRVFDLFSQGGRGLDRAQGGLGIGLAIVKSLVELHGGSVSAHSEGIGKGSEFVVILPAAVAGQATSPRLSATTLSGPQAAADTTSHRKVLIVDDNQDGAETLAEALGDLNFLTRIAFDGPSALELVGAFKPDVMLIDVGLPVMDGYELVRRLRASGLSSVRLIAVTGYGQESDRRRALEAGFDEHLVKPVDLGRLQSMLWATPR
jgi:signal transduction histidine kinase